MGSMFLFSCLYKKTAISLFYLKKCVPLQRIADMAQLVEQRIRNA